MAVATTTAVELLHFAPENPRGTAMFDALARAAGRAGIDLVQTERYHGDCPWLMVWGPGAPNRFESMRRQVAAGGHVIAFDLPYWQRDRKVRISIDAAHPQAWVMQRDWPASRLNADRVATGDRWKADGPVIVAGLGRKARTQYGESTVLEWEAAMLRICAARWPSRKVLYRRKQADAPIPAGAALTSDQPIDQVLNGASLLVTWHSNVAVDAIRLGIPVVCMDGAAAAVSPRELGVSDPAPLPTDVRDRFLANLAWFQWAPTEASACWSWLGQVLS